MKYFFPFMICFACASEIGFSQKPEAANTVSFNKITLTNDFISEGVAVGDVNHDDLPDIMAGSFWFEAPNWKRHELARGLIFNPGTTFSNSFLDFSMDVNQDGWVDLIRVGFPGKEVVWYENPQNKSGFWKVHVIDDHIGDESPALVDVDADGRPDIVCNDPVGKKFIWLKSPTVKGDTLWKKYIISNNPDLATNMYTHGLGFGDVNRDGRKDILITEGWWETPVDRTQPDWVFHPADFGEDCSQIYIMDLDGDGDEDLMSSSAHNYGIWWHEQQKDASGKPVFIHHLINKSFSETHGLALADINGDGLPDLVTGKRYYAHLGNDAGAHEPSVLYWFEFKPGKIPAWTPHLIDENSGVGLQVLVEDINQDGLPDIIVANKKGVFIFERIKR